MTEQKHTYLVSIDPEQSYSLSDYRQIIGLELERMQRLIKSHEHVREGERWLVEPDQVIEFSLTPPSSDKRAKADLFHRFGANAAYYGIPVRPKPERQHVSNVPEPFNLTRFPAAVNTDKELQDYLRTGGKIVCASDEFWAKHHNLIHTKADLSDAQRYGWEESAPAVPVQLAANYRRFTPFTFQSWLYYRAACETEQVIIILDWSQLDWVAKNAAHLLPPSAIILVCGNGECAVSDKLVDTGMKTRDGQAVFSVEAQSLIPQGQDHEEKIWPMISVVVCSYNQGDYLEICLKSILDQNYPNLELIVIDAESTDSSGEILERYRDQCSHLVIEKDNGQSDALNKGFRLASGDIMTWVCSDDGLEPGSLHKVGKEFQADQKLDIVVGGCRRIDTGGNNLSIHHTHMQLNQTQRLSFGDMISFGHTWLRSFFFIQPELFWSRRIWEKSGAFIVNHMYFAMDYELFLRFALAGARTRHIPDCLAFALVHDAQKSAHLGRNLPTIVRMMEEFDQAFSKLENKSVRMS